MSNARLHFADRAATPEPPWTWARTLIWVLLLLAMAGWGVLIVIQ